MFLGREYERYKEKAYFCVSNPYYILMRLIKMTGGLGNQMFIYALYLRMRRDFPDTRIDLSDMMHYRVHNGYEMHRVFGLPKVEFCINRTLKKILEFLFFRTILERKQGGSLRPYRKSYVWPWVYFKGFYQTERYFEDHRDEVRKAFTFDMTQANEQSRALVERLADDENAVSIHVRRGDYLLPQHAASMGGVCTGTYYANALRMMGKRVKEPHYYVFSDDMDWVREHLPLPDAIYVDWNKGADSWQDMMLMSRCSHHIIANSSFSWWGAWLSASPEKVVIAPCRWVRQSDDTTILPESWLKADIV